MEGKLTRTEIGYKLRYERILKHPIQKVWAALSDPKQLANWLKVVEFDAKVGGRILTIHDDLETPTVDRILRFEPPKLLQHTWWELINPRGIVTWRLEEHDGGCRLTLIYEAPVESSDNWARDMTGWHLLINFLKAHVDGQDVSDHERPIIHRDGSRVGGTGIWSEFESLEQKYGAYIKEALRIVAEFEEKEM